MRSTSRWKQQRSSWTRHWKSARDASANLARARNLLNQDLQELTGQIGSVNSSIEELLSNSAVTLGSMGEVLQEKIARFSTSVQSISNDTATTSEALEKQLEALSGISTEVLSSIVDLSDRFDVHGRALSGASQAILRTTEKLDGSVGTQVTQMDTISESIADRTNRAEQALQLTSERLGFDTNRRRRAGRLPRLCFVSGCR